MPCQVASMPKCIEGGWSLLVQEVQSVGNVEAVAWQRDSRPHRAFCNDCAHLQACTSSSLPSDPAFSLWIDILAEAVNYHKITTVIQHKVHQ